jgi:hypothetical protein
LSDSTLPSSDPGTQKRRSTRIVQAVPITVSGVDALGQPFKERTTTVMVNCHGCKYQSKHYVPKNSVVTIEIPRMEPAFPPRIVPGHVVWVQRPRTVRELFQIGLEFEAAGNVWGIAFPPEDWVPCAEDEAAAKAASEIEVIVETKPIVVAPKVPAPAAPLASSLASSPENGAQVPGAIPAPPPMRPVATPAASAPVAPAGKVAPTATPSAPAPPATTSSATPAPPAATGEAKIHVMPSPAAAGPAPGSQDAQIVIARQMAKIVAEAKETLDKTLRRGAQTAINEEMTIVRQQLDAQMHETVEHAIKSSMERVSEAEVKKVVLQAANKTAAIVEEARLASQSAAQQNAQQIEATVREAVQKAVTEASAQAASHAAAITEQARKAAEEAARVAAEQAAGRTSGIVEEARRAAEQAASRAAEQVESRSASLLEEARRAAQEAAAQAAELAASRATSALEEARKSSEAQVQQLEERVRISAQQAAVQAATQAAQDVTAQAVSHEKLKHSVEEVVGRVIAEREANIPSLQVLASPEAARQHIDEWKKNLEETAQGVRGQTLAQTEADAEAASRRWHEEMEAMLSGSSQKLGQRLNEVSLAAIANTEKEIAERSGSLRALIDEVVSGAESAVLSLGTELAQQRAETEQARAQLQEEARLTLEQTRSQMADLVAAQHDAIARRSEEVIAERVQQLEPLLQNSAQKVLQHFSGELDQEIAPRLEHVQRAVSEIANASDRAAELRGHLIEQVRQAAEQVGHLHNSIQERVQAASDTAVKSAVAELAFAGEEAVRLQETVREEIRRASEQVSQAGSATVERINAASGEAAQKLASEIDHAGQLVAQLKSGIGDQVDQAALRVAELESKIRGHMQQASEQAAEIQMLAREQARQASDHAVQEAVERMKQETAKFPAELEQTCRVTITKLEEELDQKSSEMQHSAYEALLKTSEWYQKKAQTSMNSTMERVVEQSTTSMREKAAEVSSMVASELDHYRRSYVDHSRAEIEEAGKEVRDRERQKLNETAEIASATFTDRVAQVTQESLRRFQDSSREAIEKSRSDMEFNRESSLAEFQKTLDEKMSQGVEQAATYLQSQLMPMLESWEARREAEKQQWMLQLKQSSEESIEAYKARLENATNAWLLASAAKLGQNSQAVLDSLAKTAEKRMRDTCSQVLAGMGDVLKERMLGISTALSIEDDAEKR